MEFERIGSCDGKDILAYTLINQNGMQAKIMNYGANLLELWVPDKEGVLSDVVLGYEKIEDYFVNGPGFGCCIIPYANRIGGAKYTLNGVTYDVDKNDGNNNLHSGFNPVHKRIWDLVEKTDNSISFTAHKKDGECGFPGELDITVKYTLSDDNALRIDYYGNSDVDTPFNPTNHSYFNLSGHDTGSVMNEIVWIDADTFTYADSESIPHGEIKSVKGTPMDFTTPKALSVDTDADYDEIIWGGGFDHNYILNNPTLDKACCSLFDPESGRKLEVYTDLPGMQLYAGNFLTPAEVGKGNFPYDKRYGVCFESQFYPNSINVPEFPQPICKGGEEFHTATIFKFV